MVMLIKGNLSAAGESERTVESRPGRASLRTHAVVRFVRNTYGEAAKWKEVCHVLAKVELANHPPAPVNIPHGSPRELVNSERAT